MTVGDGVITGEYVDGDSVCFDLQTNSDTTFAGAVDFAPDNEGNYGTRGLGAPITLSEIDLPDPPEAPLALRPGSDDPGLDLYTVSTSKPSFSWDSASGATSYSIRLRDKSDSSVLKNWSTVGTATGYTYTDGVPMVGAYYFDVVGINLGGTGTTSTVLFQYIPGYQVNFPGSSQILSSDYWEVLRIQDDALFLRNDVIIYGTMYVLLTLLVCWTILKVPMAIFMHGFRVLNPKSKF